jgi:hypothetical protein
MQKSAAAILFLLHKKICPMNCVQCNNPLDSTDNFCRNCGSAVRYARPGASNKDDNNQAVTLLLIYMCWSFFMALVYLLISKVAMRSINSMDIGKIYNVIGWFSQVTNFLLLLIFSIIIKSNRARIFLIVFAAIEMLLIVGYRLVNN